MTSVLQDSIISHHKAVRHVVVPAMIKSVMQTLDSVFVLPIPLVAPVISVVTRSGHGTRLLDARPATAVTLDPLFHSVTSPQESVAVILVYREKSAWNAWMVTRI